MDEDQKTPEQDFLSMSDEDIMKMATPPVVAAPVEEKQEQKEEQAEEKVEEQAAPEQSADASSDDEEDKDEAKYAEADGDKPEAKAPEAEDKDDGKQEEKPAEKTEEKKPEDSGIDYKAEYEKLLAPFNANGRKISVTSVDEAVTLMQMGANYNKKMAALKPNLKLLKLLENNSLLSEEKISYLIDLHNRNPDAINKLVKDSGLNPMDFDAEKAGDYKPTVQSVDDRELALDAVLDEIKDSTKYAQTIQVVSQDWDGESKKIIANNPALLKVINAHMENGVFDIISAEMDRMKMLGRLNGVSDIEAYRQVGDAINARGGFNHLGSSQGKTETKQVVVPPKPKKDEDDKLKDKRRAASASKPAATASTTPADFNPLALSDEEFDKLAATKFR